jgi:hypothetical protein
MDRGAQRLPVQPVSTNNRIDRLVDSQIGVEQLQPNRALAVQGHDPPRMNFICAPRESVIEIALA